MYASNSNLSKFICNSDAKQKQPGCKKSARPMRSSIGNGHKRPKTLISGNFLALPDIKVFGRL